MGKPIIKNLIPTKQGEIRNPKGRGKGTPNRSTIAKQVLAMQAEPPEKILQVLRTMYPEAFKKKKYNNEWIATVRLWQKVILQGDEKTYKAIMDSAYGMPQGSGVNITQIQINAEIKKKTDNALKGMEL